MNKFLWTINCRLKSLLFKDIIIGMVTEENTIIFKNGSIIKVIPNAKSEDVIRGKRNKMFNSNLDYYFKHKKKKQMKCQNHILKKTIIHQNKGVE